jgi:hypothetical protein
MDAKITLSFDKDVIDRTKKFAESKGISLSRLTEYLYDQISSGNYETLDKLPISDWVFEVAEGTATYGKSKTRRQMKDKFFGSKK